MTDIEIVEATNRLKQLDARWGEIEGSIDPDHLDECLTNYPEAEALREKLAAAGVDVPRSDEYYKD